MRIQRATRVRRGRRYRILGPMIWDWVDDIMRDWGCVEGGEDEQTSVVQDASSQPPHAPDTPVVLRRTQATAVGDDTPTPDSTPRKRRRTGETSRPLAQHAIFGVFDFPDLRQNHCKEENAAKYLFYGLQIPDLFMQRVQSNMTWSLFCPNEAPGLADCWGEEFEAFYPRYERESFAASGLSQAGDTVAEALVCHRDGLSLHAIQ
ncbi:unnamed protein product, partial [Closterium sp. Yama58-4]